MKSAVVGGGSCSFVWWDMRDGKEELLANSTRKGRERRECAKSKVLVIHYWVCPRRIVAKQVEGQLIKKRNLLDWQPSENNRKTLSGTIWPSTVRTFCHLCNAEYPVPLATTATCCLAPITATTLLSHNIVSSLLSNCTSSHICMNDGADASR